MNIESLEPAPWTAKWEAYEGCRDGAIYLFDANGEKVCHDRASLEFCALARNAFDLMMRRRWYPLFYDGKWMACVSPDFTGPLPETPMEFDDPFTAIVETDKWYVKNVESK